MLLIFFVDTTPEANRVFRGGPRLWRRKPRLLRLACMARLSGWLGGTPSHCAVGWAGTVYDVGATVARVWPLHDYSNYRKGLTECWDVPVLVPPEIPTQCPAGAILSIVRALARGRTPAQNCVTFTTEFIRSAGWVVPTSIWRPSQVRDWMAAQGFSHVRFEAAASDGD